MPLELAGEAAARARDRDAACASAATEPIDGRRARDRGDQPRSRARRSRTGKLREDLYYRLNVFPIPLPPLRERGERHRAARRALPRARSTAARAPRKRWSTDGAASASRAYAWPGNVRELKNAVERAAILADDVDRPRAAAGTRRCRRATPARRLGAVLQVRVGSSLADARAAPDPRDARASSAATRSRPPRSSASA